MALIVELLDTDIHSRNDFTNKIPEIDRFLKERANKEHKLGLSDTFVIVDDGKRDKIEGYFTLSNSAVILTDIPPHLTTDKHPKYPTYGTVLLGRMGKDHNSPKGFGAIILKEAMKASLKRGTFYALEVHAKESKDDKLINYYLGFDFEVLMDDRHHLIMPYKKLIKATGGS